jgi:hypothetical protein
MRFPQDQATKAWRAQAITGRAGCAGDWGLGIGDWGLRPGQRPRNSACHSQKLKLCSGGCKRALARAALLLEVVLSMAILVSALGVFGAQLVSGLRATQAADLRTRAGALVERVLGLVEYDPEMQDRLLTEEHIENEFGDDLPGWTYQIDFKPVEEVAGLGQICISVLFESEDDVRSDVRGGRLLGQAFLLKATRAKINLVDDFGLPQEKVDEIAALMPEGFDPTDFDPQKLIALAREDPQMIMSLLPALLPLIQQYLGQSGSLPTGFQLPAGLGGLLDGSMPGGDATGALSPQELAELEALGAGLIGGGGRGGPGGGQTRGALRPPGGGPPPGAGSVTPRSGGRGARGGQSGGGGSSGGRSGRGARPAPGGAGGGQHYTIEDLMRLRDQLQTQQGGG